MRRLRRRGAAEDRGDDDDGFDLTGDEADIRSGGGGLPVSVATSEEDCLRSGNGVEASIHALNQGTGSCCPGEMAPPPRAPRRSSPSPPAAVSQPCLPLLLAQPHRSELQAPPPSRLLHLPTGSKLIRRERGAGQQEEPELLGTVTIAVGRVLPNIHQTLLPKKAGGKGDIGSASQEF